MPVNEVTPAALSSLVRSRAAKLGTRTVAVGGGSSVSYCDLAAGAEMVEATIARTEKPLVCVELRDTAIDLVRLWGALIAGRHLLAAPRAIVGPLLTSARALLGELPCDTSPHVLVPSSSTDGQPGVAAYPLPAVLEGGVSAGRAMTAHEVCAVGTLRSLRGITEAIGVVRRGAALALLPWNAPATTTAHDVHRLGVTRWTCLPNLLAAVALRWTAAGAPDRLRLVDVRGEELTVALARSLLTAKPDIELWNTYGLTESGQGCSWQVTREGLERRSFVPVGSVHDSPHVTLTRARDEEGFGEILIRDSRPPTARRSGTGLVTVPESTPTVVRTADRGRIATDGTIEYGGRIGTNVAGPRGTVSPRTAAHRVMEALPSVHAIGVRDGVVCVSADTRIDAGLRRLGQELGVNVYRTDDPPRATSGKCVQIATASTRG